jgi:hypothetical protein
MSLFRVAKRRAGAELTLSSGERRLGSFFLAGPTVTARGAERVSDLLNAEAGFFPFETCDGRGTILVNRDHVVLAHLKDDAYEPRIDPDYDVATVRRVEMTLTNNAVLRGSVRVYCPAGHDRLSDYARSPRMFRYVENGEGTFIVNSAHIVELLEITS